MMEKYSDIWDIRKRGVIMQEYAKPIVLENEELAEGVYAASGSVVSGDSGPKCDSVYMNGKYQEPDRSEWAGGTRGYKQQFGCLGCPAFTGTACGLTTHYPDSGYADSYKVDDGNRMPSWEAKGYTPNEIVTDWNM